MLYLVLAFYAGRWNRGVLPVAAALGVLLATFALVAAPSWFNRDKTGFTQPHLNAGLLGLLTLLLLPVQILLIAFAMRGFSQGWNVEREQRVARRSRRLRRRESASGVRRGPIGPLAYILVGLCRVRRWRNGRRGALKRPCPQGRVGSIPTRRTLLR